MRAMILVLWCGLLWVSCATSPTKPQAELCKECVAAGRCSTSCCFEGSDKCCCLRPNHECTCNIARPLSLCR